MRWCDCTTSRLTMVVFGVIMVVAVVVIMVAVRVRLMVVILVSAIFRMVVAVAFVVRRRCDYWCVVMSVTRVMSASFGRHGFGRWGSCHIRCDVMYTLDTWCYWCFTFCVCRVLIRTFFKSKQKDYGLFYISPISPSDSVHRAHTECKRRMAGEND